MFTKAEWDKSFIFNNIHLRREWLIITLSGRAMTVFFNVCRFFSAVMLPLLRLIVRPMIRPFGGINEEAIYPL